MNVHDPLLQRLFYAVKPCVPRRLQIAARSCVVRRERSRVQSVWPIDESAGGKPDGWPGWPEKKRFAVVMMHDVDRMRGQNQCRDLMALETERGFRSSFNFVPERYSVSAELRKELKQRGFEVGVHGLNHDGRLFQSRRIFEMRAHRVNRYLKDWGCSGFSSPSMHHRLAWMHLLDIGYSTSTFDTDPFEPQPDGARTIFPFQIHGSDASFVRLELPYTLAQDFTLFVLMKERNIDIWKKKLAWIAERGGMALLNTHPDYMAFDGRGLRYDEYPARWYAEFLDHIQQTYQGKFWHATPGEVANYWRATVSPALSSPARVVSG